MLEILYAGCLGLSLAIFIWRNSLLKCVSHSLKSRQICKNS